MSLKSLAVYKYLTYGNDESLNVEEDYTNEGLEKFTPTFIIRVDRDIISAKGLWAKIYNDLEVKPYFGADSFEVESDGNLLYLTDIGFNWIPDYLSGQELVRYGARGTGGLYGSLAKYYSWGIWDR